MVRTAYKALATALLKSLNMRVSEAKGGGHGLLASPLDTPLVVRANSYRMRFSHSCRFVSSRVMHQLPGDAVRTQALYVQSLLLQPSCYAARQALSAEPSIG